MVRCNLSILLAERNLKITKVCKDTGISRTTLTYLANNYSKGIQYDTLDTLCTYLHVSPAELISFIPIDINISYIHRTGENNEQLQIETDITYNGITRKCSLCGSAYISFSTFSAPNFDQNRYPKIPYSVDIYVELYDSCDDSEMEDENQFIINAFQSLPITFLKDIENEITNEILDDIHYEYDLDQYSDEIDPISTSFTWNSMLIKN